MVNELYEYTVNKKKEGNYKLARFGMVSLYILFMVGFFFLCYKTIIQIYAMAPVLLWIIVLFTWRYVSIEYKYTVEAGVLKLFVVYGGKKVKEKASFHIKDAIGFIPLVGAGDEIRDFAPKGLTIFFHR